MRSRYTNAAALLVFLAPILIYWIYGLIVHPAPHYDGIDPEYEYFLNSLAVFKHQPYVYVDHPGTPVEMIGSAILAVTYPWLANRPEGFISFHLNHPQVFLSLAYAFLMLWHLGCVVVFFRLASREADLRSAILGAALACMYFAIQPFAFSGSLLWSHNSFSFPLGTLLLLWLYASLSRNDSQAGIGAPTWIGLGLGTGLLAAITIFLASWAVGILTAIVLYYALCGLNWRAATRAIFAFGLSAIAGFYLAVLPVIGKMGGFWRWIYSILSHQSNYLAVPANQSAVETISGNVLNLFHLLPALCIAMAGAVGLALIAVLLWRRHLQEQPGLWALAGALSLQIIALTLVFLDRPLRAYYFLGVAAIVPVLAMVVLKLYEKGPSAHRIMTVVLSIVVLAGLIANSAQAVVTTKVQANMQAASQKIIQDVTSTRAQVTSRPVNSLMILWMYGSYSPCWGLWFADHRAGDAFDREIGRICPNQYELTGRVLLPNAKVPLESTNWDIIFTCSRYTGDVLAKEPGATVWSYPAIDWTCGKMAVILNK